MSAPKTFKLSKAERESLRIKFGGRCGYCGVDLSGKWHADHIEPIMRDFRYISGKGAVATGELLRPENDHIGNLMPSCPPCNIDKHSMSLDQWRKRLEDLLKVLHRNNPNYRHAIRFGLVAETDRAIEFHFEKFTIPSTPNPEEE